MKARFIAMSLKYPKLLTIEVGKQVKERERPVLLTLVIESAKYMVFCVSTWNEGVVT